MQIKKIMSHRLQTIEPDATMQSASEMMKKLSIRHLPVVDLKGEFIGILSDRDIHRSMTVIKGNIGKETHIQSHKRVADFMTSPVHTVHEDESIEKIVRDMLELKVSCFLVKNGDKITGIVTSDDFLLYLLEMLGESKNPLSLKRILRLK